MADLTSPLNPGERGPKSQPLTATAGSEPTAAYLTTPFVPETGTPRPHRRPTTRAICRAARQGGADGPGYKLIQPIGEGTFGAVWLAEDRAGVRVAIKFFAHGTGREWKQLQDEVRSLAQLETTAGIIPLKEVQPETNPPYFVMAFAEGGSLAQMLEAGRLPSKDGGPTLSSHSRSAGVRARKGHPALRPETRKHSVESARPAADR